MRWFGYGALGLLGIVVIALAVLWALGRRGDAGRMQASVDIDRPPADVWPWITEPGKEKAWVSQLEEVKTEGPVAAGSRQVWTMHNANSGKPSMEIFSETLAAEPGRVLTVKLSSPGMFNGKATYLLTDLGNGKTRLSCESTYEYHQAFARLLEPLITPAALKKFNGDLARLKGLAEAAPLAAR